MKAFDIKVRLIDGPSLANRVIDRSARDAILRRLGAKFKFLTIQNFGNSGTDRPSPWKTLTKRYSKRVGRTNATLDLTGELMRSIRVSQPNGESITVYTDDKKSESHQFGSTNQNIPARPFFPIDGNGNPTPRGMRILETTAQLEAQRILRSNL